jgi:lipoate-protein ligase A
MARTLRVPDEKFRDHLRKSLRESVTSLHAELGDGAPGRSQILQRFIENFQQTVKVDLVPGHLSEETRRLMIQLGDKYQTDEWKFMVETRDRPWVRAVKLKAGRHVVSSKHKAPGGLIHVICEIESNKIANVSLSGDFTMIPESGPQLVEEALRGSPTEESMILHRIAEVLKEHQIQSPGVEVIDIAKPILDAVLEASKE